ncbi:hypothetical protein Tco_0666976 [Tanacetum coccineum]
MRLESTTSRTSSPNCTSLGISKALFPGEPDLNYEEHDEEQGADDVDAQEQPNLDEDVHPELPVPDMPPFLPLRQSTRAHHPSTRYSAHDKFYLLIEGRARELSKLWED